MTASDLEANLKALLMGGGSIGSNKHDAVAQKMFIPAHSHSVSTVNHIRIISKLCSSKLIPLVQFKLVKLLRPEAAPWGYIRVYPTDFIPFGQKFRDPGGTTRAVGPGQDLSRGLWTPCFSGV